MDVLTWRETFSSGPIPGTMTIKIQMSCVAARGSAGLSAAVAPVAAASASRSAGATVSDFVAPGLKLCAFTLLPFAAEGGRNFFVWKILGMSIVLSACSYQFCIIEKICRARLA